MSHRLALAALVAVVAASACTDTSGISLPLPKKLRTSELTPERAALLRATVEIPGLLAETELSFDDKHATVSGAFVVLVTADKTTPVIVRVFGKLAAQTQEVLLGRAQKPVAFKPRESSSLALADADWVVDGIAAFDLNGNAISNIDDLVAGVDPAPPTNTLRVNPGDLQFSSGVRPGEFTRQVIVVENTSGLPQSLTPRVIGGQGLSIARIDATGTPEGGARRELPPFLLQPFQEVLLAVTFAPTNGFLVRGDVALDTVQDQSAVRSASAVSIIANSDGDPQPVAAGYDPGTLDGGAIGFGGTVIAYPPALLFGGQPLQPGTVALSDNPNDTLAVPPLGFGASTVGGIPADVVFLVQIPPRHRLSAVLEGLVQDAQLGLFILDGDALSAADGAALTSTAPGTSAESVQFRNTSSTAAVRAVIVIGGVDVREDSNAPAVNGALVAADGFPYSLLAQLNAGPEFVDDAPIDRKTGDFRGGNDVVLHGIAFEGGATVRFGTHTADRTRTSVEDDGTTVRTVTPTASSDDIGEPLTVVVTNPDGEAATLPAVFTYDPPAPEVDDVDPPTGATGGGTSLLIKGAFFSSANGGARVLIDGAACTDVQVKSSNTMTATAPAHAEGFTTLVVENISDSGDPIASAAFPFVYVPPQGNPPVITSVDPASGPVEGGTAVLISGNDFALNATVRFGGSLAQAVDIATDGFSISCRTPAAFTDGPVDVIVTNPDGRGSVSAGGFTFITLPPVALSITPDFASVFGGTRLFVDGQSFAPGIAGVFSQGANVVAAADVTFVSATRVIVTSPQGLLAGDAALSLVNPDGQASGALTVHIIAPTDPPPRILSLNPASVRVDNIAPVTAIGTGFQSGLFAFVDDTQVTVTASNATSFTFTPPNHDPGAGIVRVINPDGQSDAAALIFQAALDPILFAVNPDSVGALVPGAVVTATGANLTALSAADVHLLDAASVDHAHTFLGNTASSVRVQIDDALPEGGGYTLALDFPQLGGAPVRSPPFVAIAPAVLSEQVVTGQPVQNQPISLLVQGANLNHTRLTGVRFALVAGGAPDVTVAPALSTDSLVRGDVTLGQGAFTVSLVWAYVDAATGAPAELVLPAPGQLVIAGPCGNNVVDAGEDCDGAPPAGDTCANHGFFGGNLGCNGRCLVDTRLCNSCGDGIINTVDGEQCDGANLGGATCASLVPGSTAGAPTCTSQCTLNATGCATCGNGIIEQGEQCDGTNVGTATCATLGAGFNVGNISCDASCRLSGADCANCGDNRCDSPEENSSTCFADCGFSCGNGICESASNETCTTCPGDCGGQCAGPFSVDRVSAASVSGSFSKDVAGAFVVRVHDSTNAPLVGVRIAFTPPPGGNCAPAFALSDSSGNASTLMTLPKSLGSSAFTATGTGPDTLLLGGAPISVAATSTDVATGTIVGIGNQQHVFGHTPLTDGSGNAIPVAASKMLFGMDGGSAASGIVARADGALFVSDSNFNRVVRIDPSGNVVLVAGADNGAGGNSGDGGLATAARLSFPRGLALNAAGDLFIVDVSNSRVRKVDHTTGIMSAFAGGGPSGQPNDGDGALATGAFLSGPVSVAVRNDGVVFITQANNGVVRRVDTNGIISTAIPTGQCNSTNGIRTSFVSSGQLAFDAQNRLVFPGFVSDFGGCPAGNGEVILRLEADQSLSFVAGGGSNSGESIQARGAQLSSVGGLAVDTAGNTFYADRSTQRIRKVSTLGVINTVAGTQGQSGFTGDGGPAASALVAFPGYQAFTPAGDLVFTDGSNHNIRLIRGIAESTPAAIVASTIGDNQSAPIGLSLPASIGLLVTDSGGAGVAGVAVAVSPSAGAAVEPTFAFTDGTGRASFVAFLGKLAGQATFTINATGIDGLPLGTFLVHATATDVAPGRIISVVNQVSGAGVTPAGGAATRIKTSLTSFDEGLISDPADGSLFLADHNNHRVLKIEPSGRAVRVAGLDSQSGASGDGGPATAARLSFPRGLALDADKNLYIADGNNGLIRVVFASDGHIERFAGGGPAGGNNGDGLVATGANLSNPGALVVSPVDGTVFVVDEGHNRVRRILQQNPANLGVPGQISTLLPGNVGCTGAVFQLNSFSSSALAFDKGGRLYVTGFTSDFGGCAVGSNGAVGRVDNLVTGAMSPIAGGATLRDAGASIGSQLQFPVGLAVDAAGDLFVADRNTHTVRRIDVLGRMTTAAGITNTAGFLGDYGAATSARLNVPSALAMDPTGNLFVIDENNQLVRMVRGVGTGTADTATLTIVGGDPQSATIGQTVPVPLRVRLVDSTPAAVVGLNVSWQALDAGDTALQTVTTTNTLGETSIGARVGFSTAGPHRFRATFKTLLEPVNVIGSPRDFTITAVRPPSGNTVAYLNNAGVGGFTAVPAESTEMRANFDFGAMAVAPDGTVFFSDTFNQRVLEISPEGHVDPFAGTGTAGFSDNVPATSGQLSSPRGLAIDELGNVYIADTNNNRIRIVDAATRTITTYAGNGTPGGTFPFGDGGPATGANLSNPIHIAFQPSTGDLFVSDPNSSHNEIRRIIRNNPALIGDETIVAEVTAAGCTTGNLRAFFNTSQNLVCDASGALYFSGTISNFGGCPVTQGSEHILKDVGGVLSLIAGNSNSHADGQQAQSTQMFNINGLTITPAGDLFFVEDNQHIVRKIPGALATGLVTTVAGTQGTAGFSGFCTLAPCLLTNPIEIAALPNNDVLIAEDGRDALVLLVH